MSHSSPDAIVIRDVVKTFRKSTIRKEHTTLKSELVRWLRRQPKKTPPSGTIPALRGIDLVIPRGKTVGLIGRNGSGKSTLLKLITGIYSPTSGSIEVNGRISALLDLGAGFHPDFSGRENILINGIILGMSRAEVKARMDEIIAFSELGDFIDEPVRTYSSGMYMRLAFAVATHVDPDILIVDEILAVGDEHFSRKSRAKMNEFKRRGKTILLVTHDLSTLESWCDTAAWIDAGRIREMGAPADVIRHYRQALALAEESGSPMVAPALDPRGGALPDVGPGTASAQGVQLTSLRLLAADGTERTELDTEEGMELRIGYSTAAAVAQATIGISIRHTDGTRVYQTTTATDGFMLPAPLPQQGEVRMQIDRIGLVAARYELEVFAETSVGGITRAHIVTAFEVRSAVRDEGLVRPVHRWELHGGRPEAEAPRARNFGT